MATVIEIGAGENPRDKATKTLDIREDLDYIDYPGVDISREEWPISSDTVDEVLAYDILEHIPPSNLGHVWDEIDRVLKSDGELTARLPHAGTWSAMTDMTHYGSGGTTPDISRKFEEGTHGYWSYLDWDVKSYAIVQFPSVLRPSLRLKKRVKSGHLSAELVKLPFVTATVHIHATK